ncbi:MAG: hypothetical protein F4Z85_04925 [Gemmatimonadetes bacterium]|nr:hypothetical protein [Gemmatimonadota bacterium]MYB71174.1 hypothetical protein [Gemmatimonadota bacterium]
MTHSPWPIKPGGGMTFTVEVQEDGSPASGQTVSFSVSPADGTASLSSSSATTDSKGQAQTKLTLASDAAGTYTVTASLDNGLSVSGTATVDTSSGDGLSDDGPGTEDTAQQPELDGSDSGPGTEDTAQQSESDGSDSGLDTGGTAQQSESDGASGNGSAVVEEFESATLTATATEQTSDSQEDPLASLSTTIDDVTSAAEHGRMTFTVRLEPTPTAPTAVKYATASRTAIAGVDYEAASGTLDFEAGQSTDTFTVRILHDEQDEPDEIFGVRIVHPSTGALLAEATGTITDDDGATPPEADSDADAARAFGFADEVEDQAYTAGTAINALVLPEATGGEGEVIYRVFDLPAGLTFDAATRTISGTPEAATEGAVKVAYTAQDSTEATLTLTFSIVVNPPLSFGDLFDSGGG